MSSAAPARESETAATATPPRVRGAPPGKRRALVVGASSGIGAALVRRLASEGYRVAALARRGEELEQLAQGCAPDCERAGGAVFGHTHDVTDADAVPALFERVARELGGLDLFVYAAGIMPPCDPDEYDTEQDLGQVAVNLGGCIAWCNEAARLFRSQREGVLVGISSVAGDRGRRGNPVYAATKAAMATYLEALRNRLSGLGIHVLTVKPGYVDTAMTEGTDGLFWLISADEAARTILASARNRLWNTRYVPLRWGLVGAVIRAIPSFVFRRLEI